MKTCGVAVALVSVAVARAQLAVPVDADLFGDAMVREVVDAAAENATPPPEHPAPGLAHLLLFHDGTQLRGELLALTADELSWRRPDVSEPLRFARAEVRGVFLTPLRSKPGSFVAGTTGAGAPVTRDANLARIPATVKLPGGDWLHGDLSSRDGRAFSLKLEGAGTVTFSREQMKWLYFDIAPAPAFAFAGSALSIYAWAPRSIAAKFSVADGTLSVTSADDAYIGRSLPDNAPQRFEVAIELPEFKAVSNTRLWLQPFGPRIDSKSTATVQFQFGRRELARLTFVNGTDRKSTPTPPDGAAKTGPVSYRVFYDGPGNRWAALLNGALVGDWPLRKDAAPRGGHQPVRIKSVCFDRLGLFDFSGNERHEGIRLNDIRVLPWDGVIPKTGEPAETRDVLSTDTKLGFAGKLEAVTEKELIFSGAKKPREAGTYIRFPNKPDALGHADALLTLGEHGEFSAAGLVVRDGLARAQTAFAKSVEIPLVALQSIGFVPRDAAPPEPADLLVFKNGDELRGTLLGASAHAALRWKTRRGQEARIATGRVAGVRLGVGRARPAPGEAATLELRNGDHLRGEVAAFDEQQIVFTHALFVAKSIARDQLRALYPARAAWPWDGGADPEKWLGLERDGADPMKWRGIEWLKAAGGRTATTTRPNDWASHLCLDGRYLARGPAFTSVFSTKGAPGLSRKISDAGERYEVRFEATGLDGQLPGFSLKLGTWSDTPYLIAVVDGTSFVLRSHGNPEMGGRIFAGVSQRIAWADKLKNLTSRLSMRALVDSKGGTAAFFLNGTLIAKCGRNASERLPGVGAWLVIGPSPYSGSNSAIISKVWIGPWNGELPSTLGDGESSTALANGDSVHCAPTAYRDGTFVLESDVGTLDVPSEKVVSIDFGGAMETAKVAARIRLGDGSVVHVDAFQWDARELTAHSAILGDLRVPAAAVSELIFHPAPSARRENE